MTRPLVPGLISEGPGDDIFLAPLIGRQLEALLSGSKKHEARLDRVQLSLVCTVDAHAEVRQAAEELARDCHIVFIHHDHKERAKAEKLVTVSSWGKSVPVILCPRVETEAWILADPDAFAVVRGARADLVPKPQKLIEKVGDPKALLDKVLAEAKRSCLYEHHAALARHVDLSKLAALPAYNEWLEATRQALKGLNYL